MKLDKTKILLFGLGVTGLASLEALYGKCELIIFDESGNGIEEKYAEIPVISKIEEVPFENVDFILKSPGIYPDHPLIEVAHQKGIEVISDIELAYRLFPEYTCIAITGTNGKTTTTAMVHHILQEAGYTAHLLGNIGVGVLPSFFKGTKDDYYVIECSSFQLEHSPTFRAKVCAILNLTPDHVNWHKTEEKYYDAKLRLARNQKSDDFYIYNEGDSLLKKSASEMAGKRVPFSYNGEGLHLEGDMVYDESPLFSLQDYRLLGKHNIENALAAIAMTKSLGLDLEDIKKAVLSFGGVAHRIEWIREYHGIQFYNDSKGTNVDASIKAIEAMTRPIRLLAGGMDKKISYAPFIETAKDKVKKFYLYGETKELLAKTIEEIAPMMEYSIYNTLDEATNAAYKEGQEGEVILLSPASASWDMYKSFEERGDHFRTIVMDIQ